MSVVKPGQAVFSPGTRRRIELALSLLIVATGVGCSKSEPPRVPTNAARGQVLLNGQPLSGALVILHPQGVGTVEATGAKEPLPAPSARGLSQADGRFTLSTYDTADGVPEGDYAVTVVQRPAKKDGDSFEPGPNVLPKRYADPRTSGLRVKIAAGDNELSPIALTQAQ